MVFVGTDGVSTSVVDHRNAEWVNNALGMLDANSESVVARYAGVLRRLPKCNIVSYCPTHYTRGDGGDRGSHYIRFREGWYPQEAVEEAGITQIPMQRLIDDILSVQPGIRRLRESSAPLQPFDLCDAELASDAPSSINAFVTNDDPANITSDPPQEVLADLDAT